MEIKTLSDKITNIDDKIQALRQERDKLTIKKKQLTDKEPRALFLKYFNSPSMLSLDEVRQLKGDLSNYVLYAKCTMSERFLIGQFSSLSEVKRFDCWAFESESNEITFTDFPTELYGTNWYICRH